MQVTKHELIYQNQTNKQTFKRTINKFRHSSHNKKHLYNQTQYRSAGKYTQEQEEQEQRLKKISNSTMDAPAHKNSKDTMDARRRRVDSSVDQIYNLRKNAYKNYIREIYIKINQELRKKNSYFNIVPQNIKMNNYSDALTTKQCKPSMKWQQAEAPQIKQKIKEKLKLQKLQEETASLEKIRHKLFVIKKSSDKRLDNALAIDTVSARQKRLRQTFFNDAQANTITEEQENVKIEADIVSDSTKKETEMPSVYIAQKRKEKAFTLSIPSASKKIAAEDYVPSTSIFNIKDPFVCGLHSDKQSTQQKNREKILNYIDFLWKVNYSNGLFVRSGQEPTYKAFVGNGNNSLMVKSILKRRFWWTVSDKQEGCHFVWTQLKQNSIFRDQQSSSTKKQAIYNFNVDLLRKQLAEMTKSRSQGQQRLQNKIFNTVDLSLWMDHSSKNYKSQLLINQKTYLKRAGLLSKKNITIIEDSHKLAMHSHVQQNYSIGNKKALFYHMKKYYSLTGMNLFQALPLTFHLVKGMDDPQYKHFLSYYNKFESMKKKTDEKNMWIVKPGEYSNRGNGISVCYSLDDIHIRLKGRERSNDGTPRTFIIQKYIEKPLLYKNRKFDIRHFMLITCLNGSIKAYWYPQGYIRTSSSQFTLKRGGNLLVHLTNDAVQKNSEEYSKYQKGNKISYDKFQSYLDKQIKGKHNKNIFYHRILPKMKELTKNSVKATYLSLDEKRKENNFQLLGMDFMIDEDYEPCLIEINTNPCLELSCPLLTRLLPSIIEDTFKLCIDPLFPPPQQWTTNKKNFLPDNALEDNKFELIFDESIEGAELQKLFHGDYKLSSNIGKIQQDAQIYENDGEQQWQTQSPSKQ